MKLNNKFKEKQIITTILVVSLFVAGFVFFAGQASAQGFEDTGFENICNKTAGLAKCVQQIYIFALGLAAVVALLMIILAGYRYMTAAGNAQQVENAKDAFASSFIGLIIIFIAFILLYLINPDLVQLRQPPPPDFKVAQANTVNIATSDEIVRGLNLQALGPVVDSMGGITMSVDGKALTLTPSGNQDMANSLLSTLAQELPKGAAGPRLGSLSCAQYSVNDPSLLPESITSAIRNRRSNEILVCVGSLFVADAQYLRQDLLTSGGTELALFINLIAKEHFGVDLDVARLQASAVRFMEDPVDIAVGSGGGSGSGGSGSGSGAGTGSPAATGGGSFIPCTLEVFCEDPETGDRYEPGPSGCQGAGFDGPAGTRQVSECLYEGDPPSCNEEIRFDFRNCQVALDSIRIGSSNNFDVSGLPNTRGLPGTLLAVPGINAGSVNILCSYGDQSYEAAACGAAMSGGYCESWFNNPGCIPR